MALPLSYNFRNLLVRRATTFMTALGIGLTVAVLLSVLALVHGLNSAFQSTGNPLHVLVTRKGSASELASNFTRSMFQDLRAKPGILRIANGEPMASLEMVTVINLPKPDNPDGMNVTLRGLTPMGFTMREDVRLSEGRMFQTGRREVVVGKSIAGRFPSTGIGNKLRFGRGEWEVVGIMDAGRSAMNSEIFADLNQTASDFSRTEVLSSALLRAGDAVTVQALIDDLNTDRRLNVEARTEREYYDEQTVSAEPVKYLGLFVAVIMAVGSSFAAMNTMYASVSRRAREIGTLRVLGFSRGAILLSFVAESLLLALLGGVIGCILVLPLNGISAGIGNFITFSETSFDFRISPTIMLAGVSFALIMGMIGGFFPALFASRKEILNALREM